VTARVLGLLWPAVGLLAVSCAATPPATVCPPLREYPAAFSARLADEVETAPADAAWPEAVTDYIGLRDQIRAACP